MILPRWDDPIIKLHSVFTEMNIPTNDCQQSRARVSGLLTHEMPSLGAGEPHLLVDIIVSRRTNSKSGKDLTWVFQRVFTPSAQHNVSSMLHESILRFALLLADTVRTMLKIKWNPTTDGGHLAFCSNLSRWTDQRWTKVDKRQSARFTLIFYLQVLQSER